MQFPERLGSAVLWQVCAPHPTYKHRSTAGTLPVSLKVPRGTPLQAVPAGQGAATSKDHCEYQSHWLEVLISNHVYLERYVIQQAGIIAVATKRVCRQLQHVWRSFKSGSHSQCPMSTCGVPHVCVCVRW
jgi:hypothetical protein